MLTSVILQQRVVERASFLERVITLLQKDERVVACWLYGSLGRGTEDAWSDIDLWVVVLDESIEAIRNERHEYVSLPGKPVVMVDAPQNAPTEGAFLSVLYEGMVAGPQHVDWTWQAQSAATLPSDAKVLFTRVELAEKQAIAPQSVEERAENVANEIAFFWMMLPIVAKYVVRGQPWKAMNLLTFVRYTLDNVRWLVGATETLPEYPSSSSTPPPAQPADQLLFLRDLAREAEELVQSAGKERDNVSLQARTQVYELLDLAVSVVQESV